MKLIVGLGNPGPKYSGTRHNVGSEVVALLASRWSIECGVEKFHARFGRGEVRGQAVTLLSPTTYMNRSGQSVASAARFYKIDAGDLMVVVDDLALPLGRLRLRPDGSSGGHNGLQDIIDRVGTQEWCRLRVGIDAPMGSSTSHVLGRFVNQEATVIKRAVQRAADAVECWLVSGVDLAMTRFNGDLPET